MFSTRPPTVMYTCDVYHSHDCEPITGLSGHCKRAVIGPHHLSNVRDITAVRLVGNTRAPATSGISKDLYSPQRGGNISAKLFEQKNFLFTSFTTPRDTVLLQVLWTSSVACFNLYLLLKGKAVAKP